MNNSTGALSLEGFVKVIHGDGFIPMLAKNPTDGGGMKARDFLPNQIDDLRRWADKLNGGGHAIYFGVNPLKMKLGKKASKDDIREARWVWVDCDPEKDYVDDALDAWRLSTLDSLSKAGPPPTLIVDSGRGYWAFWQLAEPIPCDGFGGKNTALIESVLRGLCSVFGGDKAACNIDRIARCVGFINHKTGRTSAVIEYRPERFYALDDFPREESHPALGDNGAGLNGPGEINSPHARRVVQLWLEQFAPLATEGAKGRATTMQVLQQCKDRGVSHEVAIEMMEVLWSHRCTPPWAPGEIAQHFKNLRRDKPIGVKLKSQTPAAGQLVVSPNTPVKTARKIVEAEFTRDGVRTMQHYQGEFLIWDGKRHRAVREDTIESVIYKSLDVAQRRTMAGLISFDPKRAHVGEVLKALTSESQLSELIDAPAWIVPGDRPPADELFPCGNGLLHLPTGCLLAPTPEFFALAASDVIFDPNAPPPELWFKFLNQLFGTDKQARQLLQEWMGYLLSMDTSLQKMFFVIGPRRSGKGTVGRIIKMLLGKDSVASPSMSSLAKEFGLQPLIAATLAIVSDVRIGAKTDKASLMENVLKISGEDAPEVPRKFIGPWKGTLRTRFMFLANELPGLDDSSAALAGRMMVLKLTESFYGKEDPGLTGKLQAELSGILNWAIEGYRSLRKRGHFIQPKSSEETVRDFERLSSSVASFIEECCLVGENFEVSVDQLYAHYKICAEEYGYKNSSKEWFCRDLGAAMELEDIGFERVRRGAAETRTYVGIRCRPDTPSMTGNTGMKVDGPEEAKDVVPPWREGNEFWSAITDALNLEKLGESMVQDGLIESSALRVLVYNAMDGAAQKFLPRNSSREPRQ